MKQKAHFIIFKELSFAKNCLKPASVPLISNLELSLKIS